MKANVRSKVRKFVRRAGAPFSPEDTELVGAELVKIAEQSAVDDVASLDPCEVFEEVFADKRHPLRGVYGDFSDVDGAAREHWIHVTRQMISSVSVVYVNMPKTAKPVPLTVYSDAPTRTAEGVLNTKRRVLSNDMLSHDPQFLASLKHKIEMVQKVGRWPRLDCAVPQSAEGHQAAVRRSRIRAFQVRGQRAA